MAIVCEDLSLYGVVLLPPGRDANLPVLLNRSDKIIASLAYSWTLIDNFGLRQRHDRLLHEFNPVLFPFDAGTPPDCARKMRSCNFYKNTVFPGSKRLVTYREGLLGDNSDVRPPNEDEKWNVGSILGSGDDFPVELTKLSLDGVFFSDGGFAGPNRLHLFERTLFAAETCLASSAMAAEALRQATPPAAFFRELEHFLGPLGIERHRQLKRELRIARDKRETLHLIRQIVKATLRTRISSMRSNLEDKTVMSVLATWENEPLPKLHML